MIENLELDDNTCILEPDYLDRAVLGITDAKKLIYDYNILVDCYAAEGMSYEEAEEWVCYNTLRGIPYMGKYSPIVVREIEEVDDIDMYKEEGESIIVLHGKNFLVLS